MNMPIKKRSLAEIIAERKLLAEQNKQAEIIELPKASSVIPEKLPASQTSIPAAIPTKKLSLAEILAGKANAQEITSPAPSLATIPSIIPSTIPLPSIESPKEYMAAIAEAQKQEEIKKEEAQEATIQTDTPTETFSLSIVLNEDQLLARELAFAGKSFCLTGAAGTGKTTAQREIAKSLLEQNLLGTHTFRVQGTSPAEYVSAPSIAFVAYTRIASGNLRRAIHKDPHLEKIFQHNITTIHNLLEYTPEFYWDYEENKEKFRFTPKRTASNPLDITHLIVEESSMVGANDLWPKLYAALRPGVQIIFIGDINQLQPIFGPSVLNYGLVQLPVVELRKVYRQKGDSSILENAHRILRGEYPLIEDEGTQIIRAGNVQHGQSKMAAMIGQTLKKWIEVGAYDPDQDIFLSPFNVQDLGTINMNKIISQYIGDMREAIVYEIITGMSKIYLAVGDKILYNKQVGYVKQIRRNMQYVGTSPKKESNNLTRFGTYRGHTEEDELDENGDIILAGYENISIEKLLDQEDGEKKRQSSHVVELEMETGAIEVLSAVGDFADATFSLGYALTVHKAQGCEWRNVYILLHKDHSVMATRELLYTACTRAKEHLILIAKDSMIKKAIDSQRIKGNNLKDKIEYFNSKITLDADVKCVK